MQTTSSYSYTSTNRRNKKKSNKRSKGKKTQILEQTITCTEGNRQEKHLGRLRRLAPSNEVK